MFVAPLAREFFTFRPAGEPPCWSRPVHRAGSIAEIAQRFKATRGLKADLHAGDVTGRSRPVTLSAVERRSAAAGAKAASLDWLASARAGQPVNPDFRNPGSAGEKRVARVPEVATDEILVRVDTAGVGPVGR